MMRLFGIKVLWSNFFVLILPLISIVFLSSNCFIDVYSTPKWYAAIIWLFILGLYIAIRTLIIGNHRKLSLTYRMPYIVLALSLVMFILSLVGIVQFFVVEGKFTSVRGSYDNPAGFASTICLGLPFIVYGISKQCGKLKFLFIAIFSVSCIAVVLSYSRAGIICVILVFLFCFLRNNYSLFKWILILASFLVVIYLMTIKQESLIGRLLIWTCSLNMIKESLLFGYGIGGFRSHYMNFQADYFRNHPYSNYEIYADNIQTPFNEYLHVLGDFGVVGLLILILGVYIILKFYQQNRNEETYTAILSFVSFLVFALFSYPLNYPFNCFMLGLNIYIIFYDTGIMRKFLMNKLFSLSLCVCSLYGISITCMYGKAEIEWKKIVEMQVYDKKILEKYDIIYRVLNEDPFFLYNYSYALYHFKDYSKAKLIALECQKLLADYDVELLLGTISLKQELYEEACSYYTNAMYMCPSRFRPLYELLKLAEIRNDNQLAMHYANCIIDKTEKVYSPEVKRIKKYAQTVLLKMS